MMDATHVLKVVVTLILAALFGYYVVHFLGIRSHLKRNTRWIISIFLAIAPFIAFGLLRIFTSYTYYDMTILDSIIFGLVCGVIKKLSETLPNKYNKSHKMRVIAIDNYGKTVEIIIDNNLTNPPLVGDIRNKIAEAYKITQSNRILIETGKGKVLKEMTKPFNEIIELEGPSLLDNSSYNNNKYGMKTVVCYIHINAEDLQTDRNTPSTPDNSEKAVPKFSLMSYLNTSKVEIRYGEDHYLTGKYPSSSLKVGEAKAFAIQSVDKFMVGTLTSGSTGSVVRIEKWDPQLYTDTNRSDRMSETTSEAQSAPTPLNSRHRSESHRSEPTKARNNYGSLKQMLNRNPRKAGSPIHNGDLIILECEGK